MNKNLTESKIDRQNVLNNLSAVQEVSKLYNLRGVTFEEKVYFVNSQVANFFEVDVRTIERMLEDNKDELENNDYEILYGERLINFRKFANENSVTDIDVGSKTRRLGISTFRTILNFAMLLKNSQRAQEIRYDMLNIVIDVVAKKTGGSSKYINQRDANYLTQAFVEETERQKFTNAIDEFVDMPPYKYGYLTNKVYESIFRENSKEYRRILFLKKNDRTRDTMYSEVLLVVASFEAGIAYELKNKSEEVGRGLNKQEVDKIMENFANHPAQQPHVQEARTKMASRDFGLREAYHEKLDGYLQPVTIEDYEKFLGDKSKSLEQQLLEHKEIFERLKDR